MKGVNWGVLYNQFKDKEFDTDRLEKQVVTLMTDDDVERKSGIYPYVLDRDERHLSIRAFSANMKREAYERQKVPPFGVRDGGRCFVKRAGFPHRLADWGINRRYATVPLSPASQASSEIVWALESIRPPSGDIGENAI
jgi:hypothetical protein